jgi:DNA-binding transcriptional LysR family regulator
MTIPPSSRMDLNLFRVLLAIHEHGGISSAARQLHLSQPAVSHALARLRRHFDDPLFIRQGNQMVPTERARRVMADVRTHLQGLQALVVPNESLDLATLNMTVRLGMRDVLEAITLPPLMANLSELAPQVRLTSVRVPRQRLAEALTLGEVDLVIDRQRRVGEAICGMALAEDTLAVVARRGDYSVKQSMSVGAYFDAKHILVVNQPEQEDPLHPVWLAAGLGPRDISLRCQHYFAAAKVAAHSDALLTLPATFARQLAEVLPLALWPMPVPMPTMTIWMYWHRDRADDPVHRWMRERVAQGAREAMHTMNGL